MEKVKISKDGSAIDFVQSDKVPVSPKKFRQGPELEGFYRFILDNDLRREALHVIDRIYLARKAVKMRKPLEALKKARDAARDALSSAIVDAPKKKADVKVAATKGKAKTKAPAKKAPAKAKKKVAAKATKKAKAKKVTSKATKAKKTKKSKK